MLGAFFFSFFLPHRAVKCIFRISISLWRTATANIHSWQSDLDVCCVVCPTTLKTKSGKMLCKNMQSERSQGIRAGDKIYNIHKRRRRYETVALAYDERCEPENL